MKRRLYLLVLASQYFFAHQDAAAIDLIVTSDTTLATPAVYDNIFVRGAGTALTVDAVLTARSNMTIESGATVTHSTRQMSGLTLDVQGTLSIAAGAQISVVGRGLYGGGVGESLDGEAFGDNDSVIAAENAGIGAGGGGSYGGRGERASLGALSNRCYGTIEDPRHLGAGGGGSLRNGYLFRGGNGGGRVTIHARALVIDGVIDASGSAGAGQDAANGRGGGAAGGAIRVVAGIVSGTGTIRADGGSTETMYANYAGAGGGGRVAIYYDVMTLPQGNVYARGGLWGGGGGTIYLKDNHQPTGILVLDNNSDFTHQHAQTPLRTGLGTIASIELRAGVHAIIDSTDVAQLSVADSLRVTAPRSKLFLNAGAGLSVEGMIQIGMVDSLVISPRARLTAGFVRVSGGVVRSGIDFEPPFTITDGGMLTILRSASLRLDSFEARIQQGTLELAPGSRLDIHNGRLTIGPAGQLVKDGAFGPGDSIRYLRIKSGGVLSHSPRQLSGLSLEIVDSLVVDAGGRINVDGMGLRGGRGTSGEAFDEQGQVVVGAALGPSAGAGGSYGGSGAESSDQAQTNPPYGVLEDPRHLGSGGGGSVRSNGFGGSGGGRVAIHAPVFVLNGSLSANGGNGSRGNGEGGGGSGGGVILDVGLLSGTGTVTTLGGGTDPMLASIRGGSGGGGRIAVRFDAMDFNSGNFLAAPGTGSNTGSPGTVFFQRHGEESGKLIVDAGEVHPITATHLRTTLPYFKGLHVRGSKLSIDRPINVVDSLIISPGSTLAGSDAR